MLYVSVKNQQKIFLDMNRKCGLGLSSVRILEII